MTDIAARSSRLPGRSGQAEEKVAQGAIDLAAHAARKTTEDKLWVHVGTYLIGEERRELARLIGCREAPLFRILNWAYRHHTAVYFLGLCLFSALFISVVVLLGLREQSRETRILIFLLSLIPVSQLALEIVNYLVIRIFPPRILAKLDFEKSGIPGLFSHAGRRAHAPRGFPDHRRGSGQARDPLPGQ